MPRATATGETTRVELKSCPGGFVVLRKFSYGENLRRQEIGADLHASGTNKNDLTMSMGVNKTDVQVFEFSHAIVEHNLEDENARVLNFSNIPDVLNLDDVIAQEIEDAIDKLNRPNEEKNIPLPVVSTTPLSESSQPTKSPPA